MVQLIPQSRIFLATEPVDFRTGIDGLAAVCRQRLRENPLEGAVYVFRNRSGTALKLLLYDGQGFWLLMKRLSQGRFHWWPVTELVHARERLTPLALAQIIARYLLQGPPRALRVYMPLQVFLALQHNPRRTPLA